MTLDFAHDRFKDNPSRETAMTLQRVAREYFAGDMIAEMTLAHIMAKTRRFLRLYNARVL